MKEERERKERNIKALLQEIIMQRKYILYLCNAEVLHK